MSKKKKRPGRKRIAIQHVFRRLGMHTKTSEVVGTLAQLGIDVGVELVQAVRIGMLKDVGKDVGQVTVRGRPRSLVRKGLQGHPRNKRPTPRKYRR